MWALLSAEVCDWSILALYDDVTGVTLLLLANQVDLFYRIDETLWLSKNAQLCCFILVYKLNSLKRDFPPSLTPLWGEIWSLTPVKFEGFLNIKYIKCHRLVSFLALSLKVKLDLLGLLQTLVINAILQPGRDASKHARINYCNNKYQLLIIN